MLDNCVCVMLLSVTLALPVIYHYTYTSYLALHVVYLALHVHSITTAYLAHCYYFWVGVYFTVMLLMVFVFLAGTVGVCCASNAPPTKSPSSSLTSASLCGCARCVRTLSVCWPHGERERLKCLDLVGWVGLGTCMDSRS